MPLKPALGRVTLGQGLDREVCTLIPPFKSRYSPLHTQLYQVVLKIVDEQDGSPQSIKLSPSLIYEKIKRSNSSLNRKSKKLLEDSIERVLAVLKQDAVGDDEVDSMEGSFDGIELDDRHHSGNGMNKNIVGMWAKGNAKAMGMQQTPSAEEPRGQSVAPSSRKRQINGEPPAKRRKSGREVDRSPPSHVNLSDLGGVDHVIQQLEDLIVLPLLQPDIYATSKIQPPRGILLHGPPGCGKTMIANAFAAELGVPFIAISAPSIVSGMSGESEKALREHFEEAKKMAPCLIFIDE